MNKSSEIKIGAFISYLTIAINILLGLIYTPWTLEVIGSSDYGLYTLTSSLISIFLLDFGMSAAVARYISNFRAQNRQSSINSFVGLSIKFYGILCAALAIILFIVFLLIDSIYVGLTSEELLRFKLVFVINAFFIILSFPVNICNGILNSYEKFIWLKSADIVNKIGTVIITIIVLLMGGGLYALVFINGLLNFMTFLIKIVIVHFETPVKVSFEKDKFVSIKGIFSFSMWSTVNSLSQQMTTNLVPSILGMTANTFSITIYGFARTIEGYVYNISQAINGLFMPTVSRIIVDKDDAEKVLPLMIKVGRINQSVINLLMIGFSVLGKEFVRLWVGEKYLILYPCILLLVFPYIISASQQIAGTSIVVLNKLKYTANINIIVSCMFLLFAYILSKPYGVVGACIAIFVGLLIKLFCTNIVYIKVLKIDIFSFFRLCHFQMLPGFLLSLFISFLLYKLTYTESISWFLFFLKAIVVSLVYLVIMWGVTWNEYEKSIIKSMINKIVKIISRKR